LTNPVVDNLSDVIDFNVSAGELSLREAIFLSTAGSQISFADAMGGGVIVLNGNPLVIAKDLTVDGDIDDDGDPDITVDGDGKSGVFNIDDGNTATQRTVNLQGLRIIRGNTKGFGGGISNAESLTLSNSVVSGNTAEKYGGGIANLGGATLTVAHSTLSSNSADYGGGGLINGGDLTLINSTLSGNSVTGTRGGAETGGGIYNAGNLTISNSTLSGNSAGRGGAIVHSRGKTLTITNSLLSNNTAIIGGAIYNADRGEKNTTITISNSTLSGNTAYYGGGIFNAKSTIITLTHSTLSGNTAEVGGGGIYNTVGQVNLISTIVGNNAATTTGDDLVNRSQGVISATSSLVENNFDQIAIDKGGNVFGLDPGLDPAGLQDNGGLTQTIALLPSSPAINRGANPDALAFDQRGPGFARVLKGVADMGAFESPFDPVAIPELPKVYPVV
jgi:hypothetical protein